MFLVLFSSKSIYFKEVEIILYLYAGSLNLLCLTPLIECKITKTAIMSFQIVCHDNHVINW